MGYEDTTVRVDSDGITIKRYGSFGSPRTIRFDDLTTVTETRLGSVGKWRLVGAGPGGGSRNWYGWDSNRRSKETAFAFDVNRFWRPTITPDDPTSFRAALPPDLDVR
jgi:hypothetical protein